MAAQYDQVYWHCAEQPFTTRQRHYKDTFNAPVLEFMNLSRITVHSAYNKATTATAIEAQTNEVTEAALILLGVGATGALAATGTVGAGHFNVASHETDPLAKVLVKL